MKFMQTGPYPVEVAFCICPKDWVREMKRRGEKCALEPFPKADGNVFRFRHLTTGATFIVVTFSPALRKRTLIERCGVVAHEATHVWQFIVEHINEEGTGWEVEACAIQWITQFLLEQLEAAGWLKR